MTHTQQVFVMHLLNAMKMGYHCWAEYIKGTYQFYCDHGRH